MPDEETVNLENACRFRVALFFTGEGGPLGELSNGCIVVRASQGEEGQCPSVETCKNRITAGISEWMLHTVSGLEAFRSASGIFTVTDMVAYRWHTDEALKAILLRHGLVVEDVLGGAVEDQIKREEELLDPAAKGAVKARNAA
ncbi:hypothetical protein [Thioalkalivibrio sp. ALE19]|uniref:hypothetical protein n=1 Tax=Thioalkalivibrio sp. ALE19 TaxID=1266909 RepID=UPI000490372E|nr:hypothetical protein [Thioalkalivibrio sp. ALE19]